MHQPTNQPKGDNMNQLQINAINRAVTSLRELELDLIVDMSVDSLRIAQYVNESCNKIE